ncbi:hypothetical protein D3C75_1281660 [compost metagenome]
MFISTPSIRVPSVAPICREKITQLACTPLKPWPTSRLGSQLISMYTTIKVKK